MEKMTGKGSKIKASGIHKNAALEKLAREYYVTERLDKSLPLATEDWVRVEQLLMQFTEFGPNSLVVELAAAIADYADDQARRAYILGQEDLAKEMREKKVA
jgi:hypothetical protein